MDVAVQGCDLHIVQVNNKNGWNSDIVVTYMVWDEEAEQQFPPYVNAFSVSYSILVSSNPLSLTYS